MNKYFFLTFFSLASYLGTLQAQENPLENTYWRVTVDRGVGSLIEFYAKDTIYSADDLESSLYEQEKYTIKGDTIYRQYLGNRICDSTIVGQYSYAFEGELLKFNLIADACEDRVREMSEFIFTKIDYSPPLSEAVQDSLSNFNFYPNPSPDGIFYYNNEWYERPEYRLYDVNGNLLQTGIIRSNGKISLKQYEGNLFFLTIKGVFGWETFRLLR